MRRRTEAPPARTEAKPSKKERVRGPPQAAAAAAAAAASRWSFGSALLNLGKCLLLIVVVPPFLNYASLQREEQLLMPKGGQIIDVGLGQKMNLLCKGRGEPTVILDAPAGMSSDVWLHVQESVSQLTQVCSYDRVGLGFSRRAMPNETTGTEKVWGPSTTGRMVDDLQRLLRAANISTPFILVGSELGALNSRFYSHIYDTQVADLVLIDPVPEEMFEDDAWNQYWFSTLLPSLHAQQLSAAAGLNRVLIIVGALEPAIKGENVSEEVVQRQKYLLSNPAHQSSAVDEHYFMNESAAQVRDITKFKPLPTTISVTVLTGDSHDEHMPEHLNHMVAELQKRFLKESYPSANHIHIKGADRRMIYKQPSAVSQHLKRLVIQRQANQRSE